MYSIVFVGAYRRTTSNGKRRGESDTFPFRIQQEYQFHYCIAECRVADTFPMLPFAYTDLRIHFFFSFLEIGLVIMSYSTESVETFCGMFAAVR